jgi:hypothetical protein
MTEPRDIETVAYIRGRADAFVAEPGADPDTSLVGSDLVSAYLAGWQSAPTQTLADVIASGWWIS